MCHIADCSRQCSVAANPNHNILGCKFSAREVFQPAGHEQRHRCGQHKNVQQPWLKSILCHKLSYNMGAVTYSWTASAPWEWNHDNSDPCSQACISKGCMNDQEMLRTPGPWCCTVPLAITSYPHKNNYSIKASSSAVELFTASSWGTSGQSYRDREALSSHM